MKNNVLKIFNNLEVKTKNIIKNGVKFCSIICSISLIMLLVYIFEFSAPILFEVGILLFQMSLLFSIEFLICGIVVDPLKKKLI